jgi:hypothetical protein
MTEIMHAKLVEGHSPRLEPTFGVADPLNNNIWQLRRPYLGVFTYRAGRSAERLVGIGVAIPGKMSGDYERGIAVSDFTVAARPCR